MFLGQTWGKDPRLAPEQPHSACLDKHLCSNPQARPGSSNRRRQTKGVGVHFLPPGPHPHLPKEAEEQQPKVGGLRGLGDASPGPTHLHPSLRAPTGGPQEGIGRWPSASMLCDTRQGQSLSVPLSQDLHGSPSGCRQALCLFSCLLSGLPAWDQPPSKRSPPPKQRWGHNHSVMSPGSGVGAQESLHQLTRLGPRAQIQGPQGPDSRSGRPHLAWTLRLCSEWGTPCVLRSLCFLLSLRPAARSPQGHQRPS